MKAKIKSNYSSLDDELYHLFRRVFEDDEASFQETIKDVEKAFSYIRKKQSEWDSFSDFNINF